MGGRCLAPRRDLAARLATIRADHRLPAVWAGRFHADGRAVVVEERVISGCPARILSDGTVEAETDDGWMRFENTEHLEEYLDGSRG